MGWELPTPFGVEHSPTSAILPAFLDHTSRGPSLHQSNLHDSSKPISAQKQPRSRGDGLEGRFEKRTDTQAVW